VKQSGVFLQSGKNSGKFRNLLAQWIKQQDIQDSPNTVNNTVRHSNIFFHSGGNSDKFRDLPAQWIKQ
jgi:hypothetical protein